MVTAINVDVIHHKYAIGHLWWKKTFTAFYFLNNGRWYQLGKTIEGSTESVDMSRLVADGEIKEVKDHDTSVKLSRMLKILNGNR